MKSQLTNSAHVVLFILVGLNGILEILGFPTALTKLLLLGAIIFIFVGHGVKTRFTLSKQLAVVIVSIFFLGCIHISNSSTIVLSVSLFQIFSPLILYYLLEGIMNNGSKEISKRMLIIFLGFQITGALVKLVLVGQNEGQGIGTVSTQAGAISAYVIVIFCLSAIALNVQKKTAFVVLSLALMFALINEKRIGILAVGFFSYLIFSQGDNHKFKFSRLVIAIPAVVGVLYVGSVLVPSLLEGYKFTAFGLRVLDYLFLVNEEGLAVGRLAGLMQTVSNLQDFNRLLLGDGPMIYLSSAVAGTTNNTNLGFNAIGSSILIARFGLVGLFGMLALMLVLLKRQSGKSSRMLVLFMIFDLMIYSSGFFLSYVGVYALLLFRSVEVDPAKTQPYELNKL